MTQNEQTDEKDVIRVSLTFKKQVDPEWYHVLSTIKNKRDRASVIGRYLKLPNVELHTGMVQPSLPESEKTPLTTAEPTAIPPRSSTDNSTVPESHISTPPISNTSTESPLVKAVSIEKPAGDSEQKRPNIPRPVNSSAPPAPRRQSLAGNMIKRGMTGVKG
jgi:hypothetical protein